MFFNKTSSVFLFRLSEYLWNKGCIFNCFFFCVPFLSHFFCVLFLTRTIFSSVFYLFHIRFSSIQSALFRNSDSAPKAIRTSPVQFPVGRALTPKTCLHYYIYSPTIMDIAASHYNYLQNSIPEHFCLKAKPTINEEPISCH